MEVKIYTDSNGHVQATFAENTHVCDEVYGEGNWLTIDKEIWLQAQGNNNSKIIDNKFIPNHISDRPYWIDGKEYVLKHPDTLPEGASFEKPLEVVAQEVRDERDKLLRESDPLALKYGRLCRLYPTNTDYTAKRAELDNYRNALCDIPQQSGFPESVIFPEPPVME